MAWPFRVTDPLLDVLEVLLDADQELHGWAIMKRTQRSGPTVYQVLERLRKVRWVECWWEAPAPPASGAEADGLDESGELARRENVPRRRYYRLSGEGAAKTPLLLAERGRSHPASHRRATPGFAGFLAFPWLRGVGTGALR